MGKGSFVKIPAKSFGRFLLGNNGRKHSQSKALVNLFEINALLLENNILGTSWPSSTDFESSASIDWNFELYKMRNAILESSYHSFNYAIRPVLTTKANTIFIMAMIHGHRSIVSYFLSTELIDINSSMFGSPGWPSYALFACSCSQKIYQEFLGHWINENIAWFGITPSILCSITGKELEKFTAIDFITYNSYCMFAEYCGLSFRRSNTELPLFPLDFACMTSNENEIKKILELTPECGYLSRLSFIVQNEEHLILILSRYSFRRGQSFNMNTPLHYSCYNNDFSTLSMLLYMDFPIKKDAQGKFPNEVGCHKMREKASIFFNLCTNIHQDSDSEGTRKFSHQLFKSNIHRWLSVLKYKAEDSEKYVGIFRYLDFNKSNLIPRKTRFNIINVFSLSNTPLTVDRAVQKLQRLHLNPRSLNNSQVVTLYRRYYDR